MKSRPLWVAVALHVATLIAAMPASPWEFDEPLFFQALHRYDPVSHHPPPPGYPLFILFAQLVRQIIPSDFATLVAISMAASVLGFILLALALRNVSGSETTGILGASFFYFSPAMLIHSTLPISEPGALALLAAAFYFLSVYANQPSPRPAALFAVFAALSVGWRIQYSIFVVPMFFTAVLSMRRRHVLIALGFFTLVCLVWLTPLTIAVGGVNDLIAYQTGQGKYLGAHDATESRSGWTPARIAFRFMGRAWGNEPLALAVLALAAAGFLVLARRAVRRNGARQPLSLLPLAVAAIVYIAVALLVMDPADGVRYSIPFVLLTAILAAAGSTAIAGRFSYLVAIVFAALFLGYTGPILIQRRLTPSPPVRAAEFARATFPPNAVALYELPLAPHASYFLSDFDPHPVDRGLEKFCDRPDVPLFIYADGATSQASARVFRWTPYDAYRKLTRNHYSASSIIPLPPERRYRPGRGVHPPERSQDGLEWRWLGSPAELRLPHGPVRVLTLRLGLPKASPLLRNRVGISVNGSPAAIAQVEWGKSMEVTMDVPAGAPVIRLDSAATFVPAKVRSMRSGDRRSLAVELYDVATRPVG